MINHSHKFRTVVNGRNYRFYTLLIWFGIIVVIVLEMGMISPPVGINVFIVKSIAPDVPMATIFRGIWPFWFAMAAMIGMLILFPQIALFLPQAVVGG